MFPRVLIFDLDDTLVDWTARAHMARRETARVLAARTGREARDWEVALREPHLDIWQRIITGVLPHEQHAVTRMRAVFAGLGHDDAQLLDEAVRIHHDTMVENIQVEPEIKTFLDQVSRRHTLCVLTNGLAEFQWLTLRSAGLDRYFEHILICSDLGCYKPDKTVYHETLRRTGAAPEETWMIGDSWPDDVEPALDLGMTAVWVNPASKPRPNGRIPHYEVHSVLELAPLLLNRTGGRE